MYINHTVGVLHSCSTRIPLCVYYWYIYEYKHHFAKWNLNVCLCFWPPSQTVMSREMFCSLYGLPCKKKKLLNWCLCCCSAFSVSWLPSVQHFSAPGYSKIDLFGGVCHLCSDWVFLWSVIFKLSKLKWMPILNLQVLWGKCGKPVCGKIYNTNWSKSRRRKVEVTRDMQNTEKSLNETS